MTQLSLLDPPTDRAELTRKAKGSRIHTVWCWLDGRRVYIGELVEEPNTLLCERTGNMVLDLEFARSAMPGSELRRRVLAMALAELRR